MITGERLIDAFYQPNVVTAPPSMTREAAFQMMAERDVSALPVVEGGEVVGILSLTDLLKTPGPKKEPIGEVMRKSVISVAPGATLKEASKAMLENAIHRLLVLRDKELVGLLAAHDVLRAIAQDRVETPLAKIMSSPVVTVDVLDPISFALDVLARSKLHGVVVLDRGAVAGVFTQVEALRAQTMPPMVPVEAFLNYNLIQLQKQTPAYRAASFASATRARRIVALDGSKIAGIATGTDLLRLIAH